MKNILSAFISLLACHVCISQNALVNPEMEALLKQFNIVGTSVAVVEKNELVYAGSFGSKNLETGTPLSNNDIFRIASISKSFSATSIMQLVESGKLKLEDDFSNLIGFKIRNPKFPGIPITLKMVLSHTSSVNDSQGYFKLDAINPATNPEWFKCYNDYAPGTDYQYCNLNFNMAGAVIEKFSGERFDSYVQNHVLRPLNLYGGYCVDSLDSSRFTTLYEYDSTSAKFIPSPMAYAPRREEISRYVMGYSTPIFSPTGGMKISAAHLATYMMMHMNRGKYNKVRIISHKSARLMQTPVLKTAGYGLALRTTTDLVAGKLMTGHTGSAYGLYSAMFFNRKEKYGFVVIINGCGAVYEDGLNPAIKAIVDCLYRNFVSSR